MRIWSAIVLLAAAFLPGALADCGPAGDATRPREANGNLLKNRTAFPAHINSKVTLGALLAPGPDETRFNPNDGATLKGYVMAVIPGGFESCNCHAHELAARDTHIDLVADPADTKKPRRHVIVEVTPRIRAILARKGIDYSTATLKSTILHKWVCATGWLFPDVEHTQNAENTAPKAPHNWRATIWEIHPVTAIAIVK